MHGTWVAFFSRYQWYCCGQANEMYESADDVVARFPTAADYAEEANAWARAVRSAFPRATVAVVGSYSEHYGSDARRKT